MLGYEYPPGVYCEGPQLWTTRDITKDDFMKVCDQMGCHPEAISEGGFKYINVPGYKTLRLHLYEQWPHIPKDASVLWRGNSDVIFQKNWLISTTLKAFEGAYPFTRDELDAWREVLMDVGILTQIPRADVYIGRWKPEEVL